MFAERISLFPSLILATVFGVSACIPTDEPWGGSGSDDDDLADDDDAADDDDSFSDQTASYPAEEAFLALAVGNTWRYDEVFTSDALPVEDDVLVEVAGRIAGPDLDPPQGNEVVAFQIEIDRLFGRDEVHWYSLDGTGTMRWVKSRISLDFFESEDFAGDGGVVMMTGNSEENLLGARFDLGWFLSDIQGYDFASEAGTIETFMYGDGQEVEALGLVVSEAESPIGLEYF
ncbi:MAG: hypothetical protein VX498_05255, partial [Myxococcota bacterium]|nr:hypothetical protein [Myxococcota bacterium]